MKRLITAMLSVPAAAVAAWLPVAGWSGHLAPTTASWAPIAAISYPAALVACIVLLMLLAVLRRWRLAALLVAALLATWPALRVNAPLNFATGHTADTPDRTFKLMTYNVANFSGTGEDESATMRHIIDSGADLVLLQEGEVGSTAFTDLPSTRPLRDELERRYPYHSRGYHDLVILSRRPYTVHSDTTLRNGFGSPDNGWTEYHFYAKAFDIDMPGGRQLRVLNVHLQSLGLDAGDRQTFRDATRLDHTAASGDAVQARRSLLSKVAQASRRRETEARQLRQIIGQCPENLVVCGDFNDVPASHAYWTVRGDDLRDAWADAGLGLTYTFNRDAMLFHIDHILYRGALRATSTARHRAGSSDHFPLEATFSFTD